MKVKLFMAGIILAIIACSKKSNTTTTDCTGTTITVTADIGDITNTTGFIQITAPTGTGYTYSVDGGAFGTSALFSGLTAGTHTVVARNSSGCTGSATLSVNPCDVSGIIGSDTGIHKIYLGSVYGGSLGLPDLHDSLTTNITGSNVVVHSKILNTNLTGIRDCKSITFDSLIFNPTDTLVINSATLGRVTIWDVRAGGSGNVTADSMSTSLKIVKGKTNLAILPNLSNVELRGYFRKR